MFPRRIQAARLCATAQHAQICETGDRRATGARCAVAAIADSADLGLLGSAAEPGGLNSARKYYL